MKHSVLSDRLQTGFSTFTNSVLQQGAVQQTSILETITSFNSPEPPAAQLCTSKPSLVPQIYHQNPARQL